MKKNRKKNSTKGGLILSDIIALQKAVVTEASCSGARGDGPMRGTGWGMKMQTPVGEHAIPDNIESSCQQRENRLFNT